MDVQVKKKARFDYTLLKIFALGNHAIASKHYVTYFTKFIVQYKAVNTLISGFYCIFI